jgi:hypothetical protein
MEFTNLLGYIDPGSGSLLLQILMASAVGALTFFRKSVGRLFSRSPRNNGKSNLPNATSAAVTRPEPAAADSTLV